MRSSGWHSGRPGPSPLVRLPEPNPGPRPHRGLAAPEALGPACDHPTGRNLEVIDISMVLYFIGYNVRLKKKDVIGANNP